MNKIDWVKKLTSRKFWLALISFITALLMYFKVESSTIENVTTIVMSFGSLIAYIISEGLVDASNNSKSDEE